MCRGFARGLLHRMHFPCRPADSKHHVNVSGVPAKMPSRRCSALTCRTQSLDLVRSARHLFTQTVHVVRSVSTWHIFNCLECIKLHHAVKFCLSSFFSTLTLEIVQTTPFHQVNSVVSHSSLSVALIVSQTLVLHPRRC